jgi:hypothetical protein
VIGKVDSYPGGGTLRTSTWEPGIYADHYGIRLDEAAAGQFPLRVQVGWWYYPSGEVIEPTGEGGEALGAVMLAAGGFAGAAPEADLSGFAAADITYGGVIRLIGYRLEGDQLALLWETLAAPVHNYTVFVHVVGAAPGLAGQGDAAPRLPTAYWRAGERFVTEHKLVYPAALSAGTYTILVGWYESEGLARLENGYPDGAYPLTTFTVE